MTKIALWQVAFLATVSLAACQSAPTSMTRIPAKITNGAIADPKGMTLYTYAKDVAGSGKSECNGPCARMWPPFSAEGDSPAGNWTIITRDDGMRQWAYKGKPLYTYSNDTKAGDRSGDNLNSQWFWAKE